MRKLNDNPPVCVVSGEEDGTIVIKPRLVENKRRRLPDVVVDIRTAEGIYVATGVSMRQLAKLDEFITAVYDWRRRHVLLPDEEEK
ncbi:MAG: hypothetical protein ACI4SV_04560 [Duodenibacillus sp.]